MVSALVAREAHVQAARQASVEGTSRGERNGLILCTHGGRVAGFIAVAALQALEFRTPHPK